MRKVEILSWGGSINAFKKVVIGVVLAIIVIFGIGFSTVYYKLNSMYDKDEADKIKDIKETNNTEYEVDGVTNILLIGVDGENIDKGNRSDAMIILTIDNDNNDIRLTSLARDTYVSIPGHSTEKLTHACAYDGPNLVIQTIRENFGINIDKYVAINFSYFEKSIDELGGIPIKITDEEVSEIEGVTVPGDQVLNGKQTLIYSRLRYIDNAYQRDNRHRIVLESIYNKLLNIDLSTFRELSNKLYSYTTTNMTPMELINIGIQAIKINDRDFDQIEFPLEGHRDGHIINKSKGWVIECDKEYNIDALNKFIFDYKSYLKEYKS